MIPCSPPAYLNYNFIFSDLTNGNLIKKFPFKKIFIP